MNNKFNQTLSFNKSRKFTFFVILSILILVGIVMATSLNIANESHAYIKQDINEAEFQVKSDFNLHIEQDSDAKFKILSAKVKTISGGDYQSLTSENTSLSELATVPEVTLQNMSDKTIVSFTLIINDKGANTDRGLYIKHQSIKPGQIFVIKPENFIGVSKNPATNPKFWLLTKDKSQVVVRVVANFADGSKWFNKNYGGN